METFTSDFTTQNHATQATSGDTAARWQRHERTDYAPLTPTELLYVPMGQATIIGIGVVTIVTMATQNLTAGVIAGATATLYTFTRSTDNATNRLTAYEVYESGANAQAQTTTAQATTAEAATVRIEVLENPAGQQGDGTLHTGGRLAYEELHCSLTTLKTAMTCGDSLSRAMLTKAGLSQDTARALMSMLIACNYGKRSGDTAPVVLNAKGKALRRSLT